MSSANNLEEPPLPGLAPPAPTMETLEPEEPVRLVPRRLIVEEERVLPDRQPRRRAAPEQAFSATQPVIPAATQIEARPDIPRQASTAAADTGTTTTPPPPRVTPRDAQVAVVFEAVSRVLSVRWLLTVAIAGSFALGLLVRDVWSGGAFLVFTSFSIPALVLLEKLQRPK